MLRVDDVLGAEVAVAERGDLRRRHVAARRLELCRAATHGEATATEQPPLPLRILRCCIKVKINLVLKILFGSLINGIFRSAFQCYSSHLFVSSQHSTDGNFIGIVFYLGWCCGNRSYNIDVVFFLFRRSKGNCERTLDVKDKKNRELYLRYNCSLNGTLIINVLRSARERASSKIGNVHCQFYQ